MKRYKKHPTKLLQIRLAQKEYDELLEFIKRFGVTKREWVMAVTNELRDAQVLRDNQFWRSHQDYAYANIREKRVRVKCCGNEFIAFLALSSLA